jgi:hypothetical protein
MVGTLEHPPMDFSTGAGRVNNRRKEGGKKGGPRPNLKPSLPTLVGRVFTANGYNSHAIDGR